MGKTLLAEGEQRETIVLDLFLACYSKKTCQKKSQNSFGFRAAGAETFPHPPIFLLKAKIWAAKKM
jgi:hypothetical protein